MGNNPTICCADNTGCERMELEPGYSFDADNKPVRQRLLRRVVETLRPVRQPGKFLKEKFASSNFEIKPMISKKVANDPHSRSPNIHHRSAQDLPHNEGFIGLEDSCSYLPRTLAMNMPTPPSNPQLRSFSSLSTQSEFGDRGRETRCERVTRRTSYCSDREGIEDERHTFEPTDYIEEAVE